ncbi:unnamed protein product [Paramecium primaurelia]|uniref:Uncharacterized protein n=1 Tax=Paramecium primaurelia TaxID=5886 RepID=A0A8S1LLU4_PARPR|nr:unnamed protein product [Paramecium primaurelia]
MENSVKMIYIEYVDIYGQKIEIMKDNGIKIKSMEYRNYKISRLNKRWLWYVHMFSQKKIRWIMIGLKAIQGKGTFIQISEQIHQSEWIDGKRIRLVGQEEQQTN